MPLPDAAEQKMAAQKRAVAAAVVRDLVRGLDRHLALHDMPTVGGLPPLGRDLILADLELGVVETLDRELGGLTWGEWWAAGEGEG